MKSVELFAGAGGLGMGVSSAGFEHEAVVEFNTDACNTIRHNQQRQIEPVVDWPLIEEDIHKISFSHLEDKIDLLSAGPPCQPFSLAGKHLGHRDTRNLFPETFRAVREIRPRAILIENVRGLVRKSFLNYFEYIVLQLSYPELRPREGENWVDHLGRLEKHHTEGKYNGLSYKVVYRVLNAADYGIPQKRERVFIVGLRSDLNQTWTFPSPTHSQDALLWEQFVSRVYWKIHGVANKDIPGVPNAALRRCEKLRDSLPPFERPWLTVRDALKGLPPPARKRSRKYPNHVFMAGARSYVGHTGSPLDEPAKTLKAGDHGVPGGENTLRDLDGSVRYFTVREAARIQTFPDFYEFKGSWSEIMRQLGNAVPVGLASVLARELRRTITSDRDRCDT